MKKFFVLTVLGITFFTGLANAMAPGFKMPTEEEMRQAQEMMSDPEFMKQVQEEMERIMSDPEAMKQIEEDARRMQEAMAEGKNPWDIYTQPAKEEAPKTVEKPTPKKEVPEKKIVTINNPAEAKKLLHDVEQKIASLRQKSVSDDTLRNIIEAVEIPLEGLVHHANTLSQDKHQRSILEEDFAPARQLFTELHSHLSKYEPKIEVKEIGFKDDPSKESMTDKLLEEARVEKNERLLKELVLMLEKPSRHTSKPLLGSTTDKSEELLKKYDAAALARWEERKKELEKLAKQQAADRSRPGINRHSGVSPYRKPSGKNRSNGYSDYGNYGHNGGGYSPRGSYGQQRPATRAADKKPNSIEQQKTQGMESKPSAGAPEQKPQDTVSPNEGYRNVHSHVESVEETLEEVTKEVDDAVKKLDKLFDAKYLYSPISSKGAQATDPSLNVPIIQVETRLKTTIADLKKIQRGFEKGTVNEEGKKALKERVKKAHKGFASKASKLHKNATDYDVAKLAAVPEKQALHEESIKSFVKRYEEFLNAVKTTTSDKKITK